MRMRFRDALYVISIGRILLAAAAKDILFLVASFYLLKQDVTRTALEVTRSGATLRLRPCARPS
jgi:hypothetical protein